MKLVAIDADEFELAGRTEPRLTTLRDQWLACVEQHLSLNDLAMPTDPVALKLMASMVDFSFSVVVAQDDGDVQAILAVVTNALLEHH